MKVLLVEPWYSGSHRAWADGWTAASGHDIDLVTLPGRFWRRRLRVGAAELATLIERRVRDHGVPDVLVATSMVDLASLVGLCRRSLGDAAVVLYCHENQVVYPHPDQAAAPDLDAAARSLQSLLAADRVIVNSRHHLDEFARGARRVGRVLGLGRGIDRALASALDDAVVVPVGVDLTWSADAATAPVRPRPSPHPVVLWPHRWDADKAPDVMVRTLARLVGAGVAFDVVLAGEDGWDGEARRIDAIERLGPRVVAAGHLPLQEYREWVRSADVVVSTARHEYFGVAAVEAMAAGCVPVLPDRCSYPELVPSRFHAGALYHDGGFGGRLRSVLADLPASRAEVGGLAAAMERFAWHVVAPLLDAEVALATGAR